MKKYHDVSDLAFEDDVLKLTIDGETRRYHLKEISSILEKASVEERNNFEISHSGYGIHWPSLDEDISVDGLLGIEHAPQWKKKIA